MNSPDGWKFARSDYVKMVPILVLALFMALFPHFEYPYAIHIDEWVHIAHSNALLKAAEIYYPDPFTGQGPGGSVVSLLELGYHLPLAIFQQLAGISWMEIANYFPGITLVFAVLSVYVFAKRMGFGWEAAFFTTLIPTTVGIMGPVFLVPVAMGLAFVPLLLFLVSNFKTVGAYLSLSVSVAFLIILHAPSAILFIIILVPFILVSLKGNFKHSLLTMLVVSIPFLVTLPWTSGLILSEAKNLFNPTPLPSYHDFLAAISANGYLTISSCLVGTFVLSIKGGRGNYSLISGFLALLVMLAVFYTLHYGLVMLYLRGMLFMMMMMSIVAGAGLAILWRLDIPLLTDLKIRRPGIVGATGIFLGLIFIGATLAVAIPDRQAIPYYYMIDSVDYDSFIWIGENVDEASGKAILDPWKATAFTAITERHVSTRIHMAAFAEQLAAYDFIRDGSSNTTFLKENGVSIVYTRVTEAGGETIEYSVDNPDLIEVAKNIYLIKEEKD